MKNLLRVEEALLMFVPMALLHELSMPWWWFAVLFLSPDVGIIGYVFGPKVGAWTYNALHHRGLGAALFFGGLHLHSEWLQLFGLVMISHACFDRVFGYGLKYTDSFRHTHLGMIGQDPATGVPR